MKLSKIKENFIKEILLKISPVEFLNKQIEFLNKQIFLKIPFFRLIKYLKYCFAAVFKYNLQFKQT